MAFSQHTADLTAGRVTYFQAGTGRPLLYLHSGGGFMETAPLQVLAQHFTVFAPVAPGFQDTAQLPNVDSMPALAALWADFIDTVIGADPVDVIGYSFGGCGAAWLAATHPDKVDQLLLQAPAGFAAPGSVALPDDPAARAKLFYKYPERMPAGFQPGANYLKTRAAVGHYLKTGYDEDLIANLGNIAALTLVLLGTDDRFVPQRAGQLLKEKLKRAHFVYVYDAGHGLEVDQADRVAEVVRDFFTRGEAFLVNAGRSGTATVSTRA